VHGISVGRTLGWLGLFSVVLACTAIMLELLHPPAGVQVARAQKAQATSEAGECVAWDNVAIVAENMSRDQLRELQRQVCPDLFVSEAQRDGN
jgi:hypothetical protein